jgi:twitching motility protein PilT
VSAQLLQILGQLDRPGSTEVVIATGRPVAVRVHGSFQTLTAAAVTLPQLMHLIRDTQLADMVPASEKVGESQAIELNGRALMVQFVRQGSELMLRIEQRLSSGPGTLGSSGHPSSPRPLSQPLARPTPTRPAAVVRPSASASGSFSVPPTGAVPVIAPGPAAEPPAGSPGQAHSPTRPLPDQLRAAAPLTAAPHPAAPAPQHTGPAYAAAPPATLIDEPSEVVAGLAALVAEARQRSATDLHIAAHRPVMVRCMGELGPLGPDPSSPAEVEALLLPLLGPQRRQELAERGYVDLAVDIPGGGRLRSNVSRQQGGLKGAFRLAVARPPTLDELGLPAAVAKVTENHQGLVVIAGPSGHGKTTTLAALVDLLNRADPIHILTIEDPVEIVHPKHTAVVSQREVGRHTVSFAAALKASLREDPDVIVIGELRDRETVEIALTAAETGHLVLATMSTPSAAKTIDRLVDMFPPADQSQVRASLGAALKAIVAQRLLPNVEGTGVVAAVELLVGVLALSNLIRDNKLFQLPNLMQRGRAFGMIRLDDSLLELVRAGKIAEEVAIRNADSKKELVAALHPVAPEPVKRGLFSRKERE